MSVQSCQTLCDPSDCSPPGSSRQQSSRQQYWSGLPFPPPGDLPGPGIEPLSPEIPALAGRFFAAASPGKLHKGHSVVLHVTAEVASPS